MICHGPRTYETLMKRSRLVLAPIIHFQYEQSQICLRQIIQMLQNYTTQLFKPRCPVPGGGIQTEHHTSLFVSSFSKINNDNLIEWIQNIVFFFA